MYGTLYLQSSYSMLKNTIPLPILIEKAKKGNYDFIALSDEQLHGMLHLFRLAQKHQIKPILGLKASIDHPLGQTGFLIYVKDRAGYQNLLKISLLKSKNELTYDALIEHQKGLIFVTSGQDTIISKSILNNQSDQALSMMIEFKQKFKSLYWG
jgi:DNA polymerase III subunit alpha